MAQSEVQYLGYVVGSAAIKPQLGKVSAIMVTLRPTTKMQVHSLLGVVAWYSGFIPNFASRAAPLIYLTHKSSPNKVTWPEPCAVAFKDLRSCLTKDPILQSPDFGKPFTIQTDASGAGLRQYYCSGSQWNKSQWCSSAGSCPPGS